MGWTVRDEQQLRARLAELERLERSTSLLAYTRATFPDYTAGPMHHQLAHELELFSEAVAAREAPRLLVMAPPRGGKSFLATERFSGWHMGKYPRTKIIQASHNADLAQGFSREVRRQLDMEVYRSTFPATRFLRGGDRSWETEVFGSYRAIGIGTGVSGFGGDILSVDDPLKDWKEAQSKRIRDGHWAWYQSTARTRLSRGGGIILTMTRWHEDDLAGRALDAAKQDGSLSRWRIVRIPAISTVADSFRGPGESFDPVRWPLEGQGGLLEIRAQTPPSIWTSLYQQNPSNPDGEVFKLKLWGLPRHGPGGFGADIATPALDDFDLVFQSWDMAFKKADDTDFVVGQVWGKKGALYFLLDQVRARMGFSETLDAVRMLSAKWPTSTFKLVEDKANGPGVQDMLHSQVEGLILVDPKGGKEARANACTFLFQGLNVVGPTLASAPWARGWEGELVTFPRGDNDDQVDATTQALLWAFQQSGQGWWFGS